MLVRIVKLSINPENTDSFLANFEAFFENPSAPEDYDISSH